MPVEIGDKAPDFTLKSDSGRNITLSQLRGKKIVLYFYPKDDTPGCTKEACDFRDAMSKFEKLNAEIIGISKDKSERHQKFKSKYQIPFTLLTDSDATVCLAYGVIKKNGIFGKTFLGIQRSTF